MKQNVKGSSLVSAIIVVMLIMVVLGASLTVASSYHKRSVNEAAEKQAYLSARSGAESIANLIEEGDTTLLPSLNEEIVVNKVEIPNDISDITAKVIHQKEGNMIIEVHALYIEKICDLQLSMILNKDNSWVKDKYSKVEIGNTGSKLSAQAMKMYMDYRDFVYKIKVEKDQDYLDEVMKKTGINNFYSNDPIQIAFQKMYYDGNWPEFPIEVLANIPEYENVNYKGNQLYLKVYLGTQPEPNPNYNFDESDNVLIYASNDKDKNTGASNTCLLFDTTSGKWYMKKTNNKYSESFFKMGTSGGNNETYDSFWEKFHSEQTNPTDRGLQWIEIDI